MKTFQSFITESKDRYDREGTAIGGGGLSHRGGTKIGADRKKQEKSLPSPHSKGEKPQARVKAIGGGKTAPASSYKQRKDVGTQRPKGRTSARLQQPEKERGSVKLSPREQQKKARAERLAAKSGGSNRKELEKKATELLRKKATQKVDPKYKPQKASGLTKSEQQALKRKGEKKLRDLRLAATGKKKESELKHPITHKEIARRKKQNK